ncbi:DUF2512 family protein [Brevibacillus ginsengisoli]|uniref:DUF2512 family protein n=1 Tax=Brevibacillus ginsengisoli TaxID=363854 RepID=UPI003CEE9588
MSLVWKLLLNGIIAVPGLLWSHTSLLFALVTSVALALITYVVGDLVILPRTTNTFASLADFIFSFSFLWAASVVFMQLFSLSGLFLTSFALSVVEYFYHDYLQRNGVHHSKHPG